MKMMDVFRKYDTDGSGSIDVFEFQAALLELGLDDVMEPIRQSRHTCICIYAVGPPPADTYSNAPFSGG